MSNPEFHTCPDCGFVWRHGHHGGHDCKGRIKNQRDSLLAALELFMELDPNFNAANDDTLSALAEDKTSRSHKMAVAVRAARRAITKAKGGSQ